MKDANQLFFNGINGATGAYLQAPITAHDVAELASNAPISRAHLNELQRWYERLFVKKFAPMADIDTKNLAQTG